MTTTDMKGYLQTQLANLAREGAETNERLHQLERALAEERGKAMRLNGAVEAVQSALAYLDTGHAVPPASAPRGEHAPVGLPDNGPAASDRSRLPQSA